MKLSLSLFRLTGITKETSFSHSFSRSPANPLLKEIFSGVEFKTLATDTPLSLTILYSSENQHINGC